MHDHRSVEKGLHEKGLHRMLESGDGTASVWEGDLEMCEDLGCRLYRTVGGQFGRWASAGQSGADVALDLVEAFPITLPSAVTQRTLDRADRSGHAAGDSVLEELPQTAGGHTQPPDPVGDPNAKSPPATATSITIAAKDSPPAFGLAAAVVSTQTAVANQHADHLTVGTRRLLEPLTNGVPFLDVPVKPTLPTHARTRRSRKSRL